eukprot:297945_1
MYPAFLLLSLFILSFAVYYQYHHSKMIKKSARKNSNQQIPIVSGGLPYAGHGISFGKDIIGFVQKACNKYGKIFKIKLFRKYLIIVCDRTLLKEYFHATEQTMSLNDALSSLYFDYGFSDNITKDYNFVHVLIKLIKQSIMVRFDVFAPTILDEAEKMTKSIKKQISGKEVQLLDVITRFVAHTSARCFIGIKLTAEFYDYLLKFKYLLNQIVILTYFLPKSLLRFVLGPFLRRYRKKMTALLADEIQKYRKDKTKKDSIIIRKSVDFYDKDLQRGFNNEEIGDIIVCLLYVSTENTALGLSSVMIDLAANHVYWNKVKKESIQLLSSNNMKSMFSSKLLGLCIHESARLNTHIFALNRIPKNKQFLGKYYIGPDDFSDHQNYCVAICEPMLMKCQYANEKYSNPLTYNPDRYLNSESQKSYDLMAWGAGEHLCPGKRFAIYEMIAAMMYLTTNFEEIRISAKDLEKINYFSPSAFAKRDATVIFKACD